MSEKTFNNVRIVHKHDVEANWLKATNFYPKQGELIVYDIDDTYNYERFKIGDGKTLVSDLPFYANSWNDLTDRPFGEKTTVIEWNGEIEDRVYVTLQDRNGIRTDIVKVAPPIDKNDLVGATVSMSSGSSMEVTDNLVAITENGSIANCADVVLIAYVDGAQYNSTFVCPEAGTYFMRIANNGVTSNYVSRVEYNSIQQLDEKYIPDTVVRISDIIEHNTSDTAHNDIRAAISDLSGLVGDTSVSEQISTAAVVNQSDWSANDETSASYIKNRTHFIYEASGEIFPETHLTRPIDSSSMTLNGIDVDVVANREYSIKWNSENYTCTSVEFESNGVLGILIGNVDFVMGTGDSGEPFVVGIMPNDYVTNDIEKAFVVPLDEAKEATISISGPYYEYHKFDERYIPDTIARVSEIEEVMGLIGDTSVSEQIAEVTDTKMNTSNPVGTGSLSMNRKSGSSEGVSSTTLGYNGSASGIYALAEGAFTSASGYASHAEGYNTNATRHSQHVEGQYNILDTEGTTKGKYVHIVGNGTALDKRSNAHTLDWNGLGWFAGGVKVGGTGQDDAEAKELATQEYVIEQILAMLAARKPKIAIAELKADAWVGENNLYSQVVEIEGVTPNSQVDLTPSIEQLVIFYEKDLGFVTENEDGVVTVYAIGQKPENDYTIQVTITEVSV